MPSSRIACPEGLVVIVMGVSGCGKSTLGAMLAGALDCPFLEGDDFHDASAVAKMRAGQPLVDDDRWPWLDRLGAAIGDALATQGRVVAACSALKRGYRERLREAIGGSVNFILLDASADELQRRLRQRSGHYMPVSLLKSQLATLELPHADEGIVTLDATLPPEQLTALVQAQLDTRIRTIGAARR